MGTLLIDGLKLEAPQAWKFYSMGMILARRDSGFGNLQISVAFRSDLRGAASPEACLALAMEFVSRAGMSQPFDIKQDADGDSLFGGFSYVVGEEFGRVWYSLVHRQLILGVYGCSQRNPEASELSECESILRSAKYA